MFFVLPIVFNSCNISFTFVSSSSMDLVIPSNIQPKIMFLYSHKPFPSINFLTEIGSSPLCPVIFGGGNTICIACSTFVIF